MNKKGFTLIELLVVIVIIGILVAIALPNFIRIKDKAKEAEVKQNCHAIQLALERYAVDSLGSNYPLFVMGGDWTDSFVVWQSWVDEQNMSTDMISNPQRRDNWEPASQEMGDTLVMEAFLPSFPENPFIKRKSDTLLPQIYHFPNNDTYSFTPVNRIVGGRESDKMWECFGPNWTGPNQSVVGDFWVHHIFNNPPYDAQNDYRKDPPGGWDTASGNNVLTGNFSYWPRGDNPNSAWGLTGMPECVGFTLAGFGSVRTSGQDVFNRNGNYKGRWRTEPCNLDCASNIYQDARCLCNPGMSPSRDSNDGGSDTIPDGVVVTLDSGVDRKTAQTNQEAGDQ